MGLFDFLKRDKTAQTELIGSYFGCTVSNADLVQRVQHAVLAFEFNPDAGWKEMIGKINANCQDEALALALYRFIPIACGRLTVPEAGYSDEYIVVTGEEDKTSYAFSRDRVYKEVLKGCKVALMVAGSKENVYNILKHGPEFGSINEALNAGSELKDLVCAPVYFV